MKYEVNWKELWRSLTKYMSLTIIFSVTAIMLVRYVSSGFNFGETFKHFTLLGTVGLIFGFWLFSAFFALIISVWFKLGYVTIKDGVIAGRNYWGRKKSFPLSQLKSIDGFSGNGINAVVANGGKYGKVFIYYQTDKIEEIVKILEAHLPEKMEA
ncbi:hypothetical protein [Alcanivorax sp.]|uniref:hypothetical protein n=1 Tax=Alcanivorax sp. TaxID=1872427 RepID=UPI000C44CDEE|nr:hypothetical protein [Alcanivorax sp.]MBQ23361.1 hypothetical protein [Alcanivorax sp.]|tara:strand:- start:6993 stop:7457 length:465 start_codon:yes stop_codon:yes gene_type:complete